MTNYRIDLAYDGSDFHGWQVQPGQRTVQGELQQALEHLFGDLAVPEGAGRTDAGVHAVGQVASFRHDEAREPAWLRRALGGLLPRDIQVHEVRQVPAEFSARHSAVARSYRYRWHRGSSVFWRRYSLEVPESLRAEPMDEAARLLLGEHDFTAFAASDAGVHCLCLVERVRVRSQAAWVDLDITANRFLHNMVRRIAGALLEVGMGRLQPSALRDILEQRDRGRGGPCLPPQALFLLGVRYPGEPGPGLEPASFLEWKW